MNKWHLIKKHPLVEEIFKEPPLIFYVKGQSLKDMLVRAKLWERLKHERESRAGPSPPSLRIIKKEPTIDDMETKTMSR